MSIVYCAAYRDGVKLRELAVEELADALEEPEVFVWLGLHEPDEALLRQVQKAFGLHELAVEDAHRAHQRPKLESYRNSLFAVLRTAWLQDETIHFGETHVFVGKRFLVSVRHGPSSTYAKVRERAEAMPSRLVKGPGFVLYALMDFVVDNYKPIVEHLESRFETMEAEIFHGRADREAIGRLYELQRQLLALRRAALPLKDVCGELMHFQEELIPPGMSVWFRDVNDHVTRVVEAMDSMLTLLAAAMQVNLAFVTVHQNDAVKRLAGWGAVLALPTVVFSLYGMNFQFMPELAWRGGYPLTLALTAGGCVLLYRKLKRSGWL